MFTALLLVSAAHAQVRDVDFACNGEARVVGVPPLEVACEAVLPTSGTWDEIVWLVGDGTVLTGPEIEYSYEEAGLYSISVILEGFEGDGESRVRRDGAVTVCGTPEPEFTVIDKGGRDYQVVNLTAVDTPRCLSAVDWEVRRGSSGDGAVLYTFETWEPRFELPEDGVYTVIQRASGLGGDSSASLRIDAEYGLTEEYYERFSASCGTLPASTMGWALVPLLLIVRRRRS